MRGQRRQGRISATLRENDPRNRRNAAAHSRGSDYSDVVRPVDGKVDLVIHPASVQRLKKMRDGLFVPPLGRLAPLEKLDQTITGPSVAEVQAISDKVDEMIDQMTDLLADMTSKDYMET